MRRIRLAGVVGGLAVVAACASAPDRPPTTPADDFMRAPQLIAATSDGAIVADPNTAAFLGFERSGRQVWANHEAMAAGAEVSCMAQCPDAVFSGTLDRNNPDPAPRKIVAGQSSQLDISTAPTRRVLDARSPSDAVIVESEPGKGSWLRVIPSDTRIPISGTSMVWAQNPQRTEAVAFSRSRDSSQEHVLRFQRAESGWRLVDDLTPRGKAWGACVAGHNGPILLVGEEPALLLDGHRRVPLHTDLHVPGECGLSTAGGAVLSRSVNGAGERSTSIRGIDLTGRQTWSRNLRGEAFVAMHPSNGLVALTHHGKLELLDSQGHTQSIRDSIASAMFTASGELVTVGSDGKVHWSDL